MRNKPQGKPTIFGETEHLSSLRDVKGLDFHGVFFKADISKRIGKIVALYEVYCKLNSGNKSEVVFLSASTLQLFIVPLLLLFSKHIKIYHHGIAENIFSESWKKRIVYRTLFSYLGIFRRITNVFLGQHAEISLRDIGFWKSNYVTERTPFDVHKLDEAKVSTNHFSVVSIGQQTMEKGFLHTKLLWRKLLDIGVSVKFAGFANQEVLAYIKKHDLDIVLANKMLSHANIDELILEADIIIFTYPPHLYRVTSSGAYFDALSRDKTIYALKNSFFEAEAKINRKLHLFACVNSMYEAILNAKRSKEFQFISD